MQNRFGLLVTDVMPIFMIVALDIVITLRFSINWSTVICSPTIDYAILREATSETYGPQVYFPLYYFPVNLPIFVAVYFAFFTLHLYHKNYQIFYLIISIRSHSRKWPWRDWQPLSVGCELLSFCVGARASCVPSYWIDTLVLKNWGKYLRYFAASPFPLQGKTNAVLKR